MRSLNPILVILSSTFLSWAAVITPRSLAQGWSLQSSPCPGGTNSCGGGACCPSGLYCFAAQTDEAASCCTSNSVCVGAIEGSPKCADSSWSLWQGFQGNDFCCEVGLIGVYQSTGNVAGTCVTSGPVGTATTARLVSTGTGTAATTTLSTTAATTTATQSTTSTTVQAASTKAVFAHYMVGSMTSAEAVTDVHDALNAGFDGFALNTHTISSSDTWNTDALNYLFAAASGTSFKLFISFDMSWGLDVSQLAAFLAPYASQSAYYKVNGQAFVSTYTGGTISNSQWDSEFIQPLISTYEITPFFVPDFDDFAGYPTGVFSAYPILNGVFSWETAWPSPRTTPANVSDGIDAAALQEAHAAGKIYMMPLSSYQFKYLGSGQDWYRIGEVNLPERMGQILHLQPDLVEVITWNDAGESHYVGDFWPEQIAGSTIGDYADGFDHKGWLQVITPFINAYKVGATSISEIAPPSGNPVGALWYRTLLTTASCSSSIANYQSARDTVNFAVILPSAGYTIRVYSNNNLIGSFAGQKGLNYNSVLGLAAGGGQMIQVVNGSNNIVASATGTKNVLTQSPNATCNWNYEVVGLS